MVITSLKDAGRYRDLCPRLAAAFEYLERTDLAKAAPGRHEIDGDRLFALVSDYTTKPASELRFERHRRYIDLQYVVSGVELIGWAPVASLRADPYDAGRDIAFLDGQGSFVRMPAGQAMLLWPEDAHMPGVAAGEPAPVRKVVVKIAVD